MLIGSVASVVPSDLVGLTRFLTNTLDNTAAFSDTNIVAFLNLEYRETQTFLLSELMYDWKENTLEGTGSGLINLVAGTNSHNFPSGLITIDRIEVNYTGGSNTWVEAEPVKMEGMGVALSNTAGYAPLRGSTNKPLYWVRDGVIYLDPVPPKAVTGGMKVYCTLLVTDLLIGGSGDQLTPVFAGSYHQLLSYGAAIRWLEQKEQFTKADKLEIKKARLRVEMVNHYSTRQADIQPSISAKKREMR